MADKRYADAAAHYVHIGSRPLAADAHLLAARQAADEGRTAEAYGQAEAVLDFARQTGATLYQRTRRNVGQGECLAHHRRLALRRPPVGAGRNGATLDGFCAGSGIGDAASVTGTLTTAPCRYSMRAMSVRSVVVVGGGGLGFVLATLLTVAALEGTSGQAYYCDKDPTASDGMYGTNSGVAGDFAGAALIVLGISVAGSAPRRLKGSWLLRLAGPAPASRFSSS